MMMRFIILLSFVLSATSGLSQLLGRDSVLLYERAVDRRLTLHKGQMRINASYGLSLFTKRFDVNGTAVRYIEDGNSEVRHTFLFDLKYGISDFVEVNAQIASKTDNFRFGEFYVVSNAGTSYSINHIAETKGFDDLLLSTDVRAPFKSRSFDLVATFGATLPTGKSLSSQPENSLDSANFADGEKNALILYHTVDHWGKSVPTLLGGLRGKMRSKRWTLAGSFEYRHTSSTSKNQNWNFKLNGLAWEYTAVPYHYQVPDQLTASVETEFQAMPWIDVFFGVDYARYSGGWYETNGEKIISGNSYLLSVHAGLEILVTHQLWMRQYVQLSAYGKNTVAPFTIFTTINFNMFP